MVKDRPGFLVNRLLMPYLNDVVQEYDDGLATAEDIDVAIELGLGYRLGPLELLDLIGLDVHLHATESAYAATLDPQFAPPPLLRPDGRGRAPGPQERPRLPHRGAARRGSMSDYTDILAERRRPGPDHHDQPARRGQQAPRPDAAWSCSTRSSASGWTAVCGRPCSPARATSSSASAASTTR